MFIFITFLLGHDSPFYEDTLTYQGENWDYGRDAILNIEPLIKMLFSIYTKYQELIQDFDTNNIEGDNQALILLSERDLTCLKNSIFLKLVYKTEKQIYTDLLTYLNKNELEFTVHSCIEITKLIDELSIYDESEIQKLLDCIFQLLEIEDEYQLTRFGIILGYPQIIVEENNPTAKTVNFGYYNMTDFYSQIVEIKSLVNIPNTTCLMKRVFSCYSRDKIFIEIFLAMMQATITNPALLKYLRAFNCEDYIGDE